MSSFLLDTHLWLWLQKNDRDFIDEILIAEVEDWQRKNQAYVSAASIWEIAILVSLGRIKLPSLVEEWVRTGTTGDGFRLLELTPDVLIESTRLPGELHRDPADRMLLATARLEDLTLVTRDKALIRYGKLGFARVIKR